MVTTKHCCYGTCNSDSRLAHKAHMKDVEWINFPKPKSQLEKCRIWVKACGRPNFTIKNITKDTYICTKHFVGGKGPTKEHPDPILAVGTEEEIAKSRKGKRKSPMKRAAPVSKQSKLDAAQTLVHMSESIGRIATDETARESLSGNNNTESVCCLCKCHQNRKESTSTQTEILTAEAEAQTQYDKYILGAKVEAIIDRNKSTMDVPKSEPGRPILSLENIKSDDKQMKYFTGLTYLQFLALFNFLGDCNNLKYWNSKSAGKQETKGRKRKTQPIDELFITLLRLRRGFCIQTLSYFFNLSETSVRSIFTTWLQFLYCHFDELRYLMFPDRQQMKKYLPKSFRTFKNIRCVIDCTEFFVQMPRNFERQGNLYSNYKHHHTFKCLIAVAPNGAAVFVSDLFEGSISDNDIFEKSGILNYLNPGDLVLADRGFTIQELLQTRQVDLNIPPFLKGREKLTGQEELLTRRIAKARIHVERYNERVKKYRLVSGTIPLASAHIANQAVFVTCCLVNFQDQLVK